MWLDYLKGMCMMAVILNHLHAPHLYGRLTYPFELAGFFFAAGYTFRAEGGFFVFLKRKARSLLLPIAALGLINAVLSCCAKGGSLLPRLLGIAMQRPGAWDDLWFVACLFVMELIFCVVARFVPSSWGKLAACAALSVFGYVLMNVLPAALPWHVENACVLAVFLCLGYVAKRARLAERWTTCATAKAHWAGWAVVLAYAGSVFAVDNYPIDVHLRQYGHFVAFMVSALLGLCVVVNLALLLERWQRAVAVRFLGYIGANTLVYYAFQSKCISLLDIAVSKFGWSSSTYAGSIACCLLACAMLAVPSYLIKRYAPFLLGRF